jgi:hypothetical protein
MVSVAPTRVLDRARRQSFFVDRDGRGSAGNAGAETAAGRNREALDAVQREIVGAGRVS